MHVHKAWRVCGLGVVVSATVSVVTLSGFLLWPTLREYRAERQLILSLRDPSSFDAVIEREGKADGGLRAVRQLANAMFRLDPNTRATAAVGLRKLGAADPDMAISALKSALCDPDALVRLNAADAIWHLSGDSSLSVPVLKELLLSEREPIPLFASMVLGRIEAQEAKDADADSARESEAESSSSPKN